MSKGKQLKGQITGDIRQVQRWLGHHSPSFTLDTYVHLLDEGIGEGLALDVELSSPTKPCLAATAA